MAERSRPRILIVTRNLPPLVGGMERLNWHMAEELARAADVRIVGPAGSAALAPDGIAVCEVPLKPLWKFLLVAAHRARLEAMGWKPDIVLAGSGLTAPLVLRAARACGARAAVYAHGLDVAVKHPVYRALWLPSVRRMHRVIANSRATAKLCRGIGVDAARVGIVHPGVESPQILPDAATIARFRTRHELGDRPLLLSVGRLSARKGLSGFVMHALPRIVAACPSVMLLIVGDAPRNALHARAQSPDDIRAVAMQVGVADNLRFLGEIPDHELESAYRAANVHVFPVRPIAGDPEGFGMVALEAAAQGLPTVAFAIGGVEDAVVQGQSGHLVQPGDYAAFAQRVIELLEPENAIVMESNSRTFAQAFTWERFGKDVMRLLLP